MSAVLLGKPPIATATTSLAELTQFPLARFPCTRPSVFSFLPHNLS